MAGAKAKPGDVKVFIVTRSFDAFNQGELYATHEDDWVRGRVAAGLLREVEEAEVQRLLQAGRIVYADGGRKAEQGAGDATVDGPDGAGA